MNNTGRRRIDLHHVGEPSSKYGYQPELFEQDLERRQQKSEALWQEFRAWMLL